MRASTLSQAPPKACGDRPPVHLPRVASQARETSSLTSEEPARLPLFFMVVRPQIVFRSMVVSASICASGCLRSAIHFLPVMKSRGLLTASTASSSPRAR